MRSQIMSLVGACLFGCAAVAAAQDAGATQTVSWEGVITGSRVYVRAGANLAAYPCTTLSSPDRVTVVDETAGWLKIMPPQGTFSAVSKDNVKVAADGTTGTIINEDIWVRAGGNLRSKDFWAIQRLIRKGEGVKILGTAGRFYKIAPPQGAYFYVSQRYVERAKPAGGTDPVVQPKIDVVQPKVDVVQPKIEPVVQPAVEPKIDPVVTISVDPPPATQPADVVKIDTSRSQLERAVAQLGALDQTLLTQIKQPIRERNFGTLVADYESLRPRIGTKLERYIDARVAYIHQEDARAEKIRRIDDMLEDAESEQQRLEAQRQSIGGVVAPDIAVKRIYAGTGVLSPSSLYTGTGAVPRRYTLVDPVARTFVGYVQCTTGAVRLAPYVGKSVGVAGTVQAEAGASVIEATAIELLGASAPPPAPKPAAPVIRPVPVRPVLPPPPPARPVAPTPKPRGDLVPVPEAAPKAAPAGSVVPTPAPKPAPVRPAPVIEVPQAAPERPAPVIEEPKAAPVRPAPVIEEPKALPKEVGGVPLIVPKNVEPKVPAVEPRMPTTAPALDPGPKIKPLPPTGMPLLDSGGSGEDVDESKYR